MTTLVERPAMRRPTTVRTILGALSMGAMLAGCEPSCGDEVARIEALLSGEALVLDPACVVRSSVTVPAGATVSATFDLPADATIHLAPSPAGMPPTTLRDARIEGGGTRASVMIDGEGAARIEGLEGHLTRGTAIAALNGARVTVLGLQLTGNVDPAQLLSLPTPAPPDRLATYGIVALAGASVVFEPAPSASRIERFASAGVGCGSATISLVDLVLHESRGVGVLAVDCDLTLLRVEIDATLASPGLPGIGIAAAGSTLSADTLALHDSPGFGLFATDTASVLTGVTIERMAQAGLWVEGGSRLTVTSSTLRENAGAAIAAVGASALRITDSEIADTETAPLPTRGGFGSEPMGDGVHVAELPGTPLEVTLTRVDLIGNTRVGLVLDGGGESLSIALEAVEVDAPETALGAVAQRVTDLPADWDADVVRVSSAARDAIADALTVSDGTPYGILMPPTLAP